MNVIVRNVKDIITVTDRRLERRNWMALWARLFRLIYNLIFSQSPSLGYKYWRHTIMKIMNTFECWLQFSSVVSLFAIFLTDIIIFSPYLFNYIFLLLFNTLKLVKVHLQTTRTQFRWVWACLSSTANNVEPTQSAHARKYEDFVTDLTLNYRKLILSIFNSNSWRFF